MRSSKRKRCHRRSRSTLLSDQNFHSSAESTRFSVLSSATIHNAVADVAMGAEYFEVWKVDQSVRLADLLVNGHACGLNLPRWVDILVSNPLSAYMMVVPKVEVMKLVSLVVLRARSSRLNQTPDPSVPLAILVRVRSSLTPRSVVWNPCHPLGCCRASFLRFATRRVQTRRLLQFLSALPMQETFFELTED